MRLLPVVQSAGGDKSCGTPSCTPRRRALAYERCPVTSYSDPSGPGSSTHLLWNFWLLKINKGGTTRPAALIVATMVDVLRGVGAPYSDRFMAFLLLGRLEPLSKKQPYFKYPVCSARRYPQGGSFTSLIHIPCVGG